MRLAWLAVVLGAQAVGAQCFYVPADTPSVGRCNWVPFGRDLGDPETSDQRYQTLLLGSELGTSKLTLCSLSFAPCGSGWGTYRMGSLSVRLAQHTGALGRDFDANLGSSPVTVLSATDYVWTVTANQWSEIRFQVPFDYDPAQGDVVVEITVADCGRKSGSTLGVGMHRQSGRQRVFDYGYTGTPPQMARFDDGYALEMRACAGGASLSTSGVGCPGARPLTLGYSGEPKLGMTVVVQIDNGPSSGPGWLMIGSSNRPPLPYALDPLGMPGCKVYISQETVLGLSFAGGKASLMLPIPNTPGLECSVFYNQAAATDPAANSAGTSVSNYGRVEIGR